MVLWVFGYGSLLWKAGFDYEERVVGFIKGYRRVFHQASTDHRGTREYPGRTVTLERHEGEVTWGAAYRVSGKDEEQLVLSVSISKPDIEQVRFSTCGTSTLSLPYKAMCPLPSL
jgi:cation transport regulator ChaC